MVAGVLLVLIVPIGMAAASPSLLEPGIRFYGEMEEDRLASSLAGGGDVDGDGLDDLLMCAGSNSEGGGNSGQAYLFLGVAGGWGGALEVSMADASFWGVPGETLGTDVDVAPDMNGDGYDDMVLSAYTGPNGDASGKVYLVLGAAAGWAMDQPIDVADASFVGQELYDRAGCSVAGAGDVDGDGFGDLLIGAYGALGDSGAVYLVRGGAAGWASDVPVEDADVTFAGEIAGDSAGTSVAGAGDVDGDGLDDILVGAKGWDGNVGKAYLVMGREGGWAAQTALSTAEASFLGETTDDYAGRAVAGAGDVDGDGFDDILIGANDDPAGNAGIVYLVAGRASGWVQDAPLANADASFLGTDPGDGLGRSLSGAGDLDGDGLDDFLIGAPLSNASLPGAGSVFVFLGRAGGFDPDTPATDANAWVHGNSPSDWMGSDSQVAGCGDVDGDGFDDFLAGSSVNDDHLQNAGVAGLIHGHAEHDLDGDGWSDWTGDCDDNDPSLNLDDLDGDGTTTCDGDCDDLDPAANAWDLDGDGFSGCDGDCDDHDWFVGPGSPEYCNGLDDDCDGTPASYEQDVDGDGFMECEECDDGDPVVYPGAPDPCGDGVDGDCAGDLADTELDDDGDGFAECEGDCDDAAPAVFPGAGEICNGGVDDDCDPATDEEADGDGDGYGPCDEEDADCDDGDPAVHPGAVEVCDGVDRDCNGAVDDIDDDEDGYGACDGDCDDEDPAIHPDAEEIPYDGVDQDCDGADLDDLDGDGFAGGEAGYDCDDADPAVHPGADEIAYDGLDQDCTGADLVDVDGDGFPLDEDCNDGDDGVYPGAAEDCSDGLDNDCDQRVDAGDTDCDVPPEKSTACSCRHDRPRSRDTLFAGLVLLALVLRARRSIR